MLTGINFSPPLYFLFNFFIQLIFPTSIEQLRIQSLIFIITGILFSFLLNRNIFGTVAAFVATILVASQSNLLLSQGQEARHYAMFFACGAWVLYMQYLSDGDVKKYKWLNFFSHICICQVHYLGIVFSGLVGISCLISNKQRILIKRIPFPVFIAWIITFPVYLHLLSLQSSHLGNWPKPNELSNLISSYNDSLLIITIIIPCLGFIMSTNPIANTEPLKKEETGRPRPLIITSFLWIFVPLLFWIISHITPLNLFVDRYFIPKEAALILLVAYGVNFIVQKLTRKEFESILISSTFALSLVLILISTKRAAFGLNKDTNYHHNLIIKESYPTSEQPIILEGDPRYFPNAYLGKYKFVFSLKNSEFEEIYSKFSKKIQIK